MFKTSFVSDCEEVNRNKRQNTLPLTTIEESLFSSKNHFDTNPSPSHLNALNQQALYLVKNKSLVSFIFCNNFNMRFDVTV